MQVIVKRIYYKFEPYGCKGDLREVKGLVDTFCCKDMEYHFGSSLIGFGVYDGYNSKDDKVNIYQYVGWDCYDSHEIKFCPFCGKEIEYVEKEART